MELQTITAGHAIELAADLARQLAGELDDVNQKYPVAKGLQQEFYDSLRQGAVPPGPNPSDAVQVFERLLLSYMASRYVIAPD